MKKLLLLFVGAALLTACKKDPGSVSGNVYYKFNDYVGNKPDAGATIKIYNLDKSAESATYEVTSDVQGNYKIADVVPGEYLLITKSKNTTAEITGIFEQFLSNSKDVNTIFGVDTDKFRSDITELSALSLAKSQGLAEAGGDGFDAGMAKYKKASADQSKKTEELVKKIPAEFAKTFTIYGAFGPKIEIKKIVVEENKDVQNNIDFGVTYN